VKIVLIARILTTQVTEEVTGHRIELLENMKSNEIVADDLLLWDGK
jgi:hypothetical protein